MGRLRNASLLHWISAAGLGVFLGLSLFTFRFAQGLSYLSNDPAACKNCHIMNDQYDSWMKSSHHSVATCNDCHVPQTFPNKYFVKAENGWHHSQAFTLQNFHEPIRIRPSNLQELQHNCIRCHSIMVGDIAAHRDVEANDARCTECHRSAGHMMTN
jgi:cytochrome c nitrite reductase small subunit